MNLKKSLIIVVGPTASGKSELAVKLAKKMNGEIISADSRQVYRGLDIGSGKVAGKWKNNLFVYKNVPHYLIDVASPLRQYSVARFQREAKKLIADIVGRGKQPIICGGTAHWVDAIAYGLELPPVKPNAQLRAKLAKLTVGQMFAKLKKLDPERAADIDSKNPRRLIRALEIVLTTGKPIPKIKVANAYDARWIGLNPDARTLDKKITKRFKEWMNAGLLKEINRLKKSGLSWKRIESFGLEYKFLAQHLQKKIPLEKAEKLAILSIRQYAKRQMTWWKRNKSIRWYADASKVPIDSY